MLSEDVSRAVGPVAAFVKENCGLVVTAAAGAAGVASAGTAFVGIGAVASGLAATIGVVGSAASAVLSPFGLVAGVLGGLGYLFVTQTDLGRRFGVGGRRSPTWPASPLRPGAGSRRPSGRAT